LNRLPDPHGQRSFLPSFSVSSLVPWMMRMPRFTFVSEANPLRRLLIVSKKGLFVEVLLVHDPPTFPGRNDWARALGVDKIINE